MATSAELRFPWHEATTCRSVVRCLAQEHNAVPRPRLEAGPFGPESSALTTRPPRLSSLCIKIETWLEREHRFQLLPQVYKENDRIFRLGARFFIDSFFELKTTVYIFPDFFFLYSCQQGGDVIDNVWIVKHLHGPEAWVKPMK